MLEALEAVAKPLELLEFVLDRPDGVLDVVVSLLELHELLVDLLEVVVGVLLVFTGRLDPPLVELGLEVAFARLLESVSRRSSFNCCQSCRRSRRFSISVSRSSRLSSISSIRRSDSSVSLISLRSPLISPSWALLGEVVLVVAGLLAFRVGVGLVLVGVFEQLQTLLSALRERLAFLFE